METSLVGLEISLNSNLWKHARIRIDKLYVYHKVSYISKRFQGECPQIPRKTLVLHVLRTVYPCQNHNIIVSVISFWLAIYMYTLNLFWYPTCILLWVHPISATRRSYNNNTQRRASELHVSSVSQSYPDHSNSSSVYNYFLHACDCEAIPIRSWVCFTT